MLQTDAPRFTTYLNADKGMPLGGLGLPLAEAHRDGIPDEKYLAALSRVATKPAIDLGVQWSCPTPRSRPSSLFFLCGLAHRLGTESRFCGVPIPSVMPSYRRLAHRLPRLDLPAADEVWLYQEHFVQLLSRLSDGKVADAVLQGPEYRLHLAGQPLPYQNPKLDEWGIVTDEDLSRFFAGFPRLKEKWWARYTGSCARTANEVISRTLGINVDVRFGSLVSRAGVEHAMQIAGGLAFGEIPIWGTDLRCLLAKKVPVIHQQEVLGVPGLFGAAWSCHVDAALNGPSVWDHSQFHPKLRYLPGVLPAPTSNRTVKQGVAGS
jgi:hypothetical protein